ncbi:GMC oxidoreductase [Neolewinella agarilytica]|uniref:Choline dehydrogenase n=1 Tax=Neolewinella agarilytica TaxID=478744 RepID=A0A1H9P988_9BACT|nr:GMC family oxidoreductase [Neolewinella agarilytica]SER44768.1 Choline dehydrogenase [Neolewinella agarilytica]
MQGKKNNTYDAIVIGTGISGGIAAMELCRKGLKTLVLERGRNIKHGDYPTAMLESWELPHQGKIPEDVKKKDYEYLSRKDYIMEQGGIHHFVKDSDHPYTEKKRFDWIRAYQTGGRSLVWGRQCYQLSDLDFEANAKEGIAIDWPIRHKDLKPWYDYVTRFVGVSGRAEGLAHFPDGPFQPPMPLNCVEDHFRKGVHAKLPHIRVSEGRAAHLTAYDPAVNLGTRGNCQYRNRCRRGCPYGGYYSSNSGPIPVAIETGNMTLVNGAAVREIIYDADKKRATGVRVKLTETGQETEFFTDGVVFLCASALNSAAILLASKSDAQPNGLGNDNDQVGRNVMDHHHSVGAGGTMEGFEDKYFKGRKPNGIYIPRFVNLGDQATKRNYLRGFGYQGGASRSNWRRLVRELSVGPGSELKQAMLEPGEWSVGIGGFGESLPNPDNRVTLNYDKLDADGLPTLIMDVAFGENEAAMRKDMKAYAVEMLEAAGVKNIKPYDRKVFPGYSIHEMGTARMGRDPKTSVLNAHNQVWNCPNLYVTDGAAMTSASNVNPSLTYMALTARAVDHAVKALNRQEL